MRTPKEWLTVALDALVQKGVSGVKVEQLARTLGVTKGSFYWHFVDREDLLQKTVAYWSEGQIDLVHSQEKAVFATARDRLRGLLAYIEEKDYRSDVAIRMWARNEAWVDDIVSQVDRSRIEYCEQIFREMDFMGDDVRVRARLVYFYQVAEQVISIREPVEARERLIEMRYDMLVSTW